MVTKLQLEGVRALAKQTVEFSSRATLITGLNAHGKSSLLEALYLLLTTRTYRARDPREAICHQSDFLQLRGLVKSATRADFELGLGLGKGRSERHLRVGESTTKLMDYLGLVPVLVQAGESLRMIAGSPGERRRLMDRVTAAAEPIHLVDLRHYQSALTQRNRLLKSAASDREFEAWETILQQTGQSIRCRRRQHVSRWQTSLASWPELFPEGAQAVLQYRETDPAPAQPSSDDALPWRALRPLERRVGATLRGPHRDDLQIVVEERNLLKYGSAGQVRAALSALTLAQVRSVREQRPHDDVLLLIDDLDTDLDPSRCQALIDAAVDQAQVIAATSKPDLLMKTAMAVIEMQHGVAIPRATGAQA
jgi:DNA replication and repair protein RecF